MEKERKIIETVISKGSQSLTYRQIYKIKDLKIKIEIKSDSIDFQCYALAYVLDGLKWNLIYSIPYSEMNTPEKLIYKNSLNEAFFYKDRNKLRENIEKILL